MSHSIFHFLQQCFNHWFRHLMALNVLMLCGFYSASTSANTPLPSIVTNELKRLNLPPNSLKIYAKELTSNDVALNWNANISGNPASSIKVLTTFVGLDILGPDYRWPTEIYYTGKLNNKVLTGDLIIKGFGDPFFVNESMDEVIAIIRQSIDHISGKLIIDNSYFKLPVNYPTSIDGADKEPYNAIPDAMNMNFGTNKVTITPHKNGKRALIDIDPPVITRKLVNNAILSNKRCRWFGFRANNKLPHTLEIKSNPSNRCRKPYSSYSVILKPHEIVAGGFKKAWLRHGGTLSKQFNSTIGLKDKKATFLWRHFSKPLSEQIQDMNKKSNNVMTRSLFLTIAAKQKGIPGTLDNAREVFRAWLLLRGIGIADKAIMIDNGSGLSRQTRITPKQMVSILQQAHQHENAQVFIESLAIAGVDGTMRKRFINHPAQGQMYVKTGTLNNVRTMAAFVYSQSGKIFAVSSIHEANGIQNQKGTKVQNKVLEWLYQQ